MIGLYGAWQALNHNCFDDPRFNLVIADGKDFAATSKDRFDVVVIDSTDPIGPGEALFKDNFYLACKRCLNPGGVLVTQNGVPFMQVDEISRRHGDGFGFGVEFVADHIVGSGAFEESVD